MMSFAETPGFSEPVTWTRKVLDGRCRRHCDGEHVFDFAGADAERQRAECAVRGGVESPQTTVMPGWVRPSSGPMTCTMP